MSGKAKRFNAGKLMYSLIPLKLLEGALAVSAFGAEKYGEFNWTKGDKWSVPFNSLMRHLSAWQSGEDNDPETQLSHIDHALCNLLYMKYYIQQFPEHDDRLAFDQMKRAIDPEKLLEAEAAEEKIHGLDKSICCFNHLSSLATQSTIFVLVDDIVSWGFEQDVYLIKVKKVMSDQGRCYDFGQKYLYVAFNSKCHLTHLLSDYIKVKYSPETWSRCVRRNTKLYEFSHINFAQGKLFCKC